MSISKAQALALADGFVDKQGVGKEGFTPVNTFSELFLIAGEMVEMMQDNLNKSNKNASGELSKSIKADTPVQKGSIVSVDIRMLFYGAFVNKGVKGLKSGRSLAGYSFKTPFPSESMVKAISDWVGRGKKSVSSVTKYKAYGKIEKKNKDIGGGNPYAIARAVKMKGLKPTQFQDKAEVKTRDKVGERLGAALKIDVINSIRHDQA